MLNKKNALIALGLSAVLVIPLWANNRPFPQEGRFEMGGNPIRPNIQNPQQMNNDVIARYNHYRDTFLGRGNGFAWIRATGTGVSASALTISEAHGYAMKIFALMAGVRGDERQIFDEMNALRKAMPSMTDHRLMSWTVFPTGSPARPDLARRSNNATDGCLDMAYALLLAHDQWGSPTNLQYMNDAHQIIAGLRQANMHNGQPNNASHRTKLGDWQNAGQTTDLEAQRTTSRSSDWRPAHFKAFARATSQDYWRIAADTVYNLLNSVSHSTTGLMPDFVIGIPARVVRQGTNEALVSGEHNQWNYSFNACRVPWFLAMDYIHYGETRARTQMNRITTWLNGISGGNPNNINAGQGFTLAGQRVNNPHTDWTSMSFMAPFAAGMVGSSTNQNFLNSMYNYLRAQTPTDVYSVAIQVLNMLLLSQNWWAPASTGTGVEPGDGCDIPPMDVATWSTGWGVEPGPGSSATVTPTGTQVNFSLNRANAGSWSMIWVAFDEGDFEYVSEIVLTYTSTGPMRLILGDPALSNNGAGYTSEVIPASATSRTVRLNPALFEQLWACMDPENMTLCQPNNQANIVSIMLAADGTTATTGTITSLEFVGFGCDSPVSIIPQNRPVSSGAARVAGRGMTITRNAINFNIPSEQMVSLQITDVRGRMLFTQDINLNAAGVGTFNIPASIQRNQTLIVNVRGRNGFNTSRKMLLTR
ncbi:MAG: glycosyl hydrolase family 8 [Chitinivibrionia bacterium]|nr:glycosyl hydrolase family 8 [Chitinivibrionia bacterium]